MIRVAHKRKPALQAPAWAGEQALWSRLKATSRSFYLSLRFLPAASRPSIALAYLLARTADTIADAPGIDDTLRGDLLARYRARVVHGDTGAGGADGIVASLAEPRVWAGLADPAEAELLREAGDGLAAFDAMPAEDRDRIAAVVDVLVSGMTDDLARFGGPPAGEPSAGRAPDMLEALETIEDLDRYTYRVAGVVGEFWTRTQAAHVPGFARPGVDPAWLESAGVRFGKGLQMANVLRDIPADLANGRCYVPSRRLARVGLVPADLLDPASETTFAPVLGDLVEIGIEHVRHGFAYTLALGPAERRLRFACALPLVFAVETLGLVVGRGRALDPTIRHKVTRRRVKAIALHAVLRAPFDARLEAFFRRALARAGFASAARRPLPAWSSSPAS